MDFSCIFFFSSILIMNQKGIWIIGLTLINHTLISQPRYIILLITFTSSLKVPVSHTQRDLTPQISPETQHREKRCSCENLKDRECVYFCHIGIVWVNTPSQVIPYGVGFVQMRMRRHVERCLCTNKRDTDCVMFCSHRAESVTLRSLPRIFPKQYKAKQMRFTS